jgi:hypothetical protein
VNDLADVLYRIREVPLASLLGELRALHAGHGPPGLRPPANPVVSPVPTAPTPATATAPAASRRDVAGGADVLAPLLAFVRRTASAASAPAAPALDAAAGHVHAPRQPARDERYALLQRHFGREEAELRRHARLTDRILDQLARGEVASAPLEPAPLQQEVRILCPARGASGARFVLRNELGRAALVELRVHRLRDADALDGLEVACEPARVELAPDGEILAGVRVDLARCAHAAAGTLELVVDAVVDDRVVQKVWVALTVSADQAAARDGRA